ncbi:Gas vesicle protein K [Desulfotomaculum arcticum]|uniref:Gas vesicle protein K n=1 Tax=Desulfotruncus arcticus DSM 17038 TaxID=1121424 RepID=A0A1I2VN21_9FIRM|nr:gas vesicle protein K [Desulfotruncus arcticus]SFG88591.1 Gas vesicle protein K [Desulfotomaculum arcticum] [Desulfotruncus arcticus DSM 17038]
MIVVTDFDYEQDMVEELAGELEKTIKKYPQKIKADPENVEQGLAKLVLTVVELLRQLMEKQALRRVERGTLTDEEIEKVGLTLMKLEEKLEELKIVFGLEGEELNIDLGPLGNLM